MLSCRPGSGFQPTFICVLSAINISLQSFTGDNLVSRVQGHVSTMMSTISGTKSSRKTDEVIGTILKHLDAMDAKLSWLDPISDKVPTLEAATGELGAQQDTLNTVVECVDQAHATLATQVNRADTVPRDQASDRPPNNGHRRTDDDDNHGGDFIASVHKLQFPKFDSSGDPLSWLNWYECYFHVRRTTEHQRVSFAAFYLLDVAHLWFHRMELNGSNPTWPQFSQLVNAHFSPPLTDSPIGELTLL
jgi:hypothetical protein